MSENENRDPAGSEHPMDRRTFLQRSGSAALGMSALGVGAPAIAGDVPSPSESRVRRYRRLGRTGFEISDISFGVAGLDTADTVRFAYDRGINYFDCAETYQRGRGERMLGEGIRGIRDKVYLTSKVITKPGWTRHQMMHRLNMSLKRLNTDYVDIYFNHAVNDIARLESPEWHEFIARAKKQGKIRFSGMSGHGGYLQDCLDYALDNDMVDVILAAHNFGSDPAFYERFTKAFDLVANQQGLRRLLAKAHKQDVGVVVMKTLMGARLNDMRPYEWGGATFAQAAFRWVLQDENIDALIVSMKNKKNIAEFLGASGQSGMRTADRRLLGSYIAANAESYCRNGCNDCAGSCPFGVPIPDVLRARMYAIDYRDTGKARESYANLTVDATPCLSCETQPCRSACPYGLELPALTRETARRLG